MMRRDLSGAALICAGALAILTAAPMAAARGASCPATASLLAGGGQVLDFNRSTPTGAPLAGTTLHQTTDTFNGHFYQLRTGSATIRYGLNTYTISAGTIFYLQCYGQSRGSATLYPSVAILQGAATVHVSASEPGAVLTWEGLYGPVPGATIQRGYTFHVVRTTTKPVDHSGELNWFGDFVQQPVGKTTVKVVGHALVNVTPYVGPRRGNCRHVHGAVLTSHGYHRVGGGFIQVGTSRYS